MTPQDNWLTIITVCFNSEKVLPRMLASVPQGVQVILVDNASNDRMNLRKIAKDYGAKLIELSENKGFGAACNVGAAEASTEYLLFLNPDVEILPNALKFLREASDRYSNASAFNPLILKENGTPRFKRRSNLLPRSEWLSRKERTEDCEVPVLVGAAIFIKKFNFEAVGGFDPKIFLYYEDDDISLRLRDKCGPLFFIVAAKIVHTGGSSSSRSVDVAKIKGYHLGLSRVYCSVKHGTPFGRTKAVLNAIYGVLSPLTVLSKRKRAKEWARLNGTLRGIASSKSLGASKYENL